MRKRIKTQVKIDIVAVSKELQDNYNRKKEVFREVLSYIMQENNCTYHKAKEVLSERFKKTDNKEVFWSMVSNELNKVL